MTEPLALFDVSSIAPPPAPPKSAKSTARRSSSNARGRRRVARTVPSGFGAGAAPGVAPVIDAAAFVRGRPVSPRSAARWAPVATAGSVTTLDLEYASLADAPFSGGAHRSMWVVAPKDPPPGLPISVFMHGALGSLLSCTGDLGAAAAAVAAWPQIVVFVDGDTPLGGTQWTNSPVTGNWSDMLAETVDHVADRFDTAPVAAACGFSSGGFGALAATLDDPDRFPVAVSLAGDCGFTQPWLPVFGRMVRVLRDEFAGDWDRWAARPSMMGELALMAACHYSPVDATSVSLPVDRFGIPVADVWDRWLAADPMVRLAADPTLGSRSHAVRIVSGDRDDVNLDLGSGAVAELLSGRCEVSFDMLPTGHSGVLADVTRSLCWAASKLAELS